MWRAAPIFLLASAAAACPWHEGAEEDAAWEPLDVFDVVTGQVPGHGELALEVAEIRADAALRWDVLDARARMQLAWARIRLGRAEEALRVVASGASAPRSSSGASVPAGARRRSRKRSQRSRRGYCGREVAGGVAPG